MATATGVIINFEARTSDAQARIAAFGTQLDRMNRPAVLARQSIMQLRSSVQMLGLQALGATGPLGRFAAAIALPFTGTMLIMILAGAAAIGAVLKLMDRQAKAAEQSWKDLALSMRNAAADSRAFQTATANLAAQAPGAELAGARQAVGTIEARVSGMRKLRFTGSGWVNELVQDTSAQTLSALQVARDNVVKLSAEVAKDALAALRVISDNIRADFAAATAASAAILRGMQERATGIAGAPGMVVEGARHTALRPGGFGVVGLAGEAPSAARIATMAGRFGPNVAGVGATANAIANVRGQARAFEDSAAIAVAAFGAMAQAAIQGSQLTAQSIIGMISNIVQSIPGVGNLAGSLIGAGLGIVGALFGGRKEPQPVVVTDYGANARRFMTQERPVHVTVNLLDAQGRPISQIREQLDRKTRLDAVSRFGAGNLITVGG